MYINIYLQIWINTKVEKSKERKPIIEFAKPRNNSKKVYILIKDNKKLKKVVINGKKYTSLEKRKATSGNYKGYYIFSSKKKREWG